MTTAILSRNLRARQSAARCDQMAAHNETRAARFPEGSALRADYLRLAADYRDTAAQWRSLVDDEPVVTDAVETRECCRVPWYDECDPECDCDACENLRALDNDADAAEER